MTARTSSPATRDLVITRAFDASRELVWKVFTEPEHGRHWWGPKDFTVPELELDLRLGGAWRAVMRSPDGKDYPQHGVYREIRPPERLVFTLIWDDGARQRDAMHLHVHRTRREDGDDLP